MTEVWLDPDWEYVSDRVMGGVSTGRLDIAHEAGRRVARLSGRVSFENNGGFVQMAMDVPRGATDPRPGDWEGIVVTLSGDGASYDMRLRTPVLSRPWQSFRAGIRAMPEWQTLHLPFRNFEPYRTDAAFDPAALRRIGLLAVGREGEVALNVAGIGFFR